MTPAFLVRLMGHHSLSRNVNLGPEDREAYSFANELRVAVLEGRLRAVWTHPANELGGLTQRRRDGSVIVPVQIAIARALGLITGSSDYLFLWEGGSCAIEFKSSKGRLSFGQTDFRDWCDLNRVPFHIARSAAEGLEFLRNHGVLQ
ncbi:MAG: hypothetical protein E6R03_15535 [Hyphomicrobiaceae bacterium]|nr:MAG: hypothetical protein E6R03_15535 [Hyphomicrobiaceae bacterium]